MDKQKRNWRPERKMNLLKVTQQVSGRARVGNESPGAQSLLFLLHQSTQLPEVGPNSSNNCLTLEASAGPLEMYLEGQDYAGFLKSLGWGEGSTFHFHGHRESAVLLQSHYVCVRARGSQRQRQTTV